jgi:hypothetical protein
MYQAEALKSISCCKKEKGEGRRERERERERERDFSLFYSLVPSGPPRNWTLMLTFRAGCPHLVV